MPGPPGADNAISIPYKGTIDLSRSIDTIKTVTPTPPSLGGGPSQIETTGPPGAIGATGIDLEQSPTAQNYQFMAKLLSDMEDPEEETAKIANSLFIADSMDITFDQAKIIHDDLLKAYLGDEEPSAKKFFEHIKDGWKSGAVSDQLGMLGYKAWLGDNSEETWNHIAELRGQLIELNKVKPPKAANAFKIAANFAYTMLKCASQGSKYGLATGGAFAATAAIAGQAGPQIMTPEEIVTVPAAFLAGYGVGAVTGAAEHAIKLEGGNFFIELLDEGGDPTIARAASMGFGLLSGAIEMLQVSTLIKTIPGGRKLLARVSKDVVKDMVLKKTLKSIAVKGAKKYVTTWASEVTEEVAQQGLQSVFRAFAAHISNETKGTEAAVEWDRALPEIWEAFKTAAVGMAILPVPGGIMTTAVDITNMVRAEKAAVQPQLIEELSPTEEAVVTPEGEVITPVVPEREAVKLELGEMPEISAEPISAEMTEGDIERTIMEGFDEFAKEEPVSKIGEEIIEQVPTEESFLFPSPEIPQLSQEEAIAKLPEQDILIEEVYFRGHTINEDLTMDLYHGTTKETAEKILQEGQFLTAKDAPDTYGVYFSTSPKISEDYGDGTVMKIRVNVADLNADDVFPGTGRMDFQVNTKRGVYKPAEVVGKTTKEITPTKPSITEKDYGVFASTEEMEAYFREERLQALGADISPALTAKYSEQRMKLAAQTQSVKARMRILTGQVPISDLVREDVALKGAMQKASRAARKAFSEGKKIGTEKEKLHYAGIVALSRERKVQRERLKRIVKDLNKARKSVEKMSPAHAEPIKQLLDGLDLVKRQKPTMLKLEKTREYLTDNPDVELPDYVMERLQRLDKRNLNDITLDELESVHDAVMHHVHLEHKKHTIKVGREAKRAEQVLKDAIDEMKPAKKIEADIIKLAPGKLENIKEFGGKIKALFGILQDHYDLIIEKLAGPNSTMDKVLYQEVKRGATRKTQYRQQVYDTFSEDVQGLNLGIKDISKWLEEKETAGGYELNRGQRIALYLHALNEDNRTALLTNGFGVRAPRGKRNIVFKLTEQQLSDIVNSTTYQERAFAGAVGRLFEAQGKALGKVFYTKNGYVLLLLDNFYPKHVMGIERGTDFASERALEQFKGQHTRVGLEKGMLEKRIGSKKAIYLAGVTYDVNRSVENAAAYVGLEIPLSNASKLLYNPKFRGELSARYGEIVWQEIEKGLRDIAGEHQAYETTEEIFLKLRSLTTTAMLGLNPFVVLKQPISYVCYMPYVKIRYLMQGMGDFLIHKKGLVDRHKLYSPEFRERLEGGFSRDVAEVMQRKTAKRLYGGKKSIQEFTMGGIQWADKMTVGAGMQGAILQVLDELETGKLSREVKTALDMKDSDIPGLSADQKMQLAYQYADYATERTQPMFAAEHRSSLSRGSASAKMFTQFSSFTNQALCLIRRSWLDVNMTKSRGAISKMGKVIFATMIANTAAIVGIDMLRDWMYGREDEEKEKTAMLRVMTSWAGYVYILRDLTQAAASAVKYGPYSGGDFSLPILRFPTLLAKSIGYGVSGFTGKNYKTRRKNMLKAIDTAAELGFMTQGLPYSGPKRLTEGIIKRIQE